MRNALLSAATSVLLIGCASTETSRAPRSLFTREQIAQQRDLPTYDDGGDFSMDRAADMTPFLPHVVALRRFVWTHWSERRRGYVRFTISGVDSALTRHLFVEPRTDGRWHIAA